MALTARDFLELADWAERASSWLERSARRPNDVDDPMRRTVAFDAASLDDFLTGFRGVPSLLEFMARNLEQQPDTKGSEIEQRDGCTIISPNAWRQTTARR